MSFARFIVRCSAAAGSAVSLRADLFQLGDGLFLGEFRKLVGRVSEGDLGMFLSRQGARLLDIFAAP